MRSGKKFVPKSKKLKFHKCDERTKNKKDIKSCIDQIANFEQRNRPDDMVNQFNLLENYNSQLPPIQTHNTNWVSDETDIAASSYEDKSFCER